MYDITNEKSFKNLEKWLNDISSNSHIDTTVVLIANKIDKQAE